MRFSNEKAKRSTIKISFEVNEPVKVLIGCFDHESWAFLHLPDALEPVSEDVADIGRASYRFPKVNLHAFRYEAGKNTLEMNGKGSYVVFGVVPADAKLGSE